MRACLRLSSLLIIITATAAGLFAQVRPNSALTADQLASRFLVQATFGPTPEAIAALRASSNDFNGWITQQAALPTTYALPLITAAKNAGHYSGGANLNHTRYARNQVMLTAPDQLRHRMAYALSQIMVISDLDDAIATADTGSANYYDMLVRNALGSFRTLLFDVTRHPLMGRYLSHYKNRKADPAAGTDPDENFAREILQLFTIGLHDLNADGTPILVDGRPRESYNNTHVVTFARVFTGFTDEGPSSTSYNNIEFPENPYNPTASAMRMWDPLHDTAAKTLFSYPGVRKPGGVLPAGQTGLQDVNDALDNLVEHPNTAPFISKILIQRLITSNPSPAYVARVSAVFVNNGSGVRGDLLAVARAILTDTEARSTTSITNPNHGRLQDPFLRLTGLLRAFGYTVVPGATPAENHLRYDLGYDTRDQLGHYPLSSPSVFNFWSPGYALPGPIANAGLTSPEFQILNSLTSVTAPNFFYYLSHNTNFWNLRLDPSRLETLAATSALLVDELNTFLCHGTMSTETRASLLDAANRITSAMTSNVARARQQLLLYLTLISPEAAIKK